MASMPNSVNDAEWSGSGSSRDGNSSFARAHGGRGQGGGYPSHDYLHSMSGLPVPDTPLRSRYPKYDPVLNSAATRIQAIFRGYLCRLRLAADELVLPPEHVIQQLDRHRREARGFKDLCVFVLYAFVFLAVMQERVKPGERFNFEVKFQPRVVMPCCLVSSSSSSHVLLLLGVHSVVLSMPWHL